MDKINTVGIVETKKWTYHNKILLDSGKYFGPITIAYETYGNLNIDKNNAILLCHALSGDAHAAGYHNSIGEKPGWWEDAVGPGKAFDTDKYFIICTNVIGGCVGSSGPSSINPETNKPYCLDFPVITISDMVTVQKIFLNELGIDSLLTIAGGSMGGMQALEWACKYPDFAKTIILIATSHTLTAQGIAFNAVGRNSIISDKNWNNGNYYNSDVPAKGLAIARMIGHITYLSDESMKKKFGRKLQNSDQIKYNFDKEFQVESYLDYQGNKFVERFDANSYLYVTKAIDYFDISQKYGNGNLDNAFKNVKANFLILSFTSDWLFPPYQSQEMTASLLRNKKEVTYLNIDSQYGHDAFLLEYETESKIISAFLESNFNNMYKGNSNE